MFLFKYALKSILSRRRQYRSLFAVCVLVGCVIFSTVAVASGMLNSLSVKARQYYGGDLQFLGPKRFMFSEDYADKIASLVPPRAEVYSRINEEGWDSTLFFNGNSSLLRMLKGVDFDSESRLFDDFTFVEGSHRARADGLHSALISEPVAKKLGVHAGDVLTFFVNTDEGFYNTIQLHVGGIFQDSSLFGMYTVYMDIDGLRTVFDYPDDFIEMVTINYFGRMTRKELVALQECLKTMFRMHDLVDDKYDFYDDVGYAGERPDEFALIPLMSNREELRMMTSALNAVVLVIVVILTVIVAVGIGSTYRVIIIKRTVETGTLRSIGMESSGVRNLFLAEIFLVLFGGLLLGGVLSLAVNFAISRFDFTFIPAFDMFLMGGRIRPTPNGLVLLGVNSLIIVTTLLSILFTIRQQVSKSPVEALAAVV